MVCRRAKKEGARRCKSTPSSRRSTRKTPWLFFLSFPFSFFFFLLLLLSVIHISFYLSPHVNSLSVHAVTRFFHRCRAATTPMGDTDGKISPTARCFFIAALPPLLRRPWQYSSPCTPECIPALFTTKLRSYYLVAQTIRTAEHVCEVEVPILIYAKTNLCFPRQRETERERESHSRLKRRKKRWKEILRVLCVIIGIWATTGSWIFQSDI